MIYAGVDVTGLIVHHCRLGHEDAGHVVLMHERGRGQGISELLPEPPDALKILVSQLLPQPFLGPQPLEPYFTTVGENVTTLIELPLV